MNKIPIETLFLFMFIIFALWILPLPYLMIYIIKGDIFTSAFLFGFEAGALYAWFFIVYQIGNGNLQYD